MNDGRTARALALACLFFSASPPAYAGAAPPTNQTDQLFARTDASAMRAAASTLDRAAAHRKFPTVSVAPDLSPALGEWLAAGLTDARKEKSAVTRAADMRALAASLRMGAELADRAPGAAPAKLNADVRQVLAEPAFRANVNMTPPKKRQQSWLGRALQSLAEWWAKVMGRVIAVAAGTPAIGNVLAIALIAAAALALAFLVFRIALLITARRARESQANFAGTPLTAHANADETYDDAHAAAQSGSYGLAIALLFQAALLALDRAGRVPYDSARTAGEYRRAVRRSVAGASGSFEALARAFTYVAYAQAPAGESDWRAADAASASMSVAAAERP